MTDFGTTKRGGVYAAAIGGQLTGYGADYIVIDDPLEIKDADNIARIDFVNDRFDTLIRNRLNYPSRGKIVIVAHRLHENDLSGHVLADGDWRTVMLPFQATRSETFDLGNGRTWHRAKGELLRPNEFSTKDLERIRNSRNFHALYQQDPAGTALPAITAKHFAVQPVAGSENSAVVVSVDAGQGDGERNSFSVVQAWRVLPDCFVLADQWRGRGSYADLRSATKRLIRRHRPCTTLIEKAGAGSALLSDLKDFRGMALVPIAPRDSKIARLRAHVAVILAGRIVLPSDAPWRRDYVAEFVEFPKSKFTDQVDATTQFLDFMATDPLLKVRMKGALAAGAFGSRPHGVARNRANAPLALGSQPRGPAQS